MKIGIDISQLAYRGTGVAHFVECLVTHLIAVDTENEYVLFFSSMRNRFDPSILGIETLPKNVTIKTFSIPPILLDILWNKLHIAPIEWFIGNVDIFITSDWVEPPVLRAKKCTILYDLIVYTYPQETDARIVSTQRRKLAWVKKESAKILCISKSTKKDAVEMLHIAEDRLEVVYPGGTL